MVTDQAKDLAAMLKEKGKFMFARAQESDTEKEQMVAVTPKIHCTIVEGQRFDLFELEYDGEKLFAQCWSPKEALMELLMKTGQPTAA